MSAHELPRAGDLAVVIRWPHPCVSKLGLHFVVGEVCCGPLICEHCGARLTRGAFAFTENVIGTPLEWCRRVPGLSELESIHIADELDAERGRKEWVPA